MFSKQELRKHYKNLRNQVAPEYQKVAKESAMKIFLENIPFTDKSIISGYYPTNNELSPQPLLEYFSSKKITTALPVIIVKDSPLEFQNWSVGEALFESPFFKIQQPNNQVVIPDIIIVPLLAFDKNKHRLGYGGGFYDRTLQQLKSAGHKFISVGYAYSFQEINFLPTHDGDKQLDYIITDEKIINT
jgi:5-formyltetrahydrofolate cyclo-ligase